MGPWDIQSDLSEERLEVVAEVIADSKRRAAELHDPHHEGPWSLGCRGYERTCIALQRACAEHEWLHMLEKDGLRCTFRIGAVPMKHFRGSAESRHRKASLTPSEKLHLQQTMAFLSPEEEALSWRAVVELDEEGYPLQVAFVQFDDSLNAFNPYYVDVSGRAAPVRPVEPAPMRREAIDLGPPPVGDKRPSRLREVTGSDGEG